jgi:endoglucanase
MNYDARNFLKNLLNTPSPSGFEEQASKIWRDYLLNASVIDHGEPHYNFNCYTDTYGNSIAYLRSTWNSKNVIMLCGHIDEVGMMINYINDEGFIYISNIGGVEATILPAQRVIIHSKDGPVKGVIGRRPPHLADDDEDEVKFHNIFIDIGAVDKENALSMVSVGDPITIDTPYVELANNRIVARGLDDRVGAWVVARVLERLMERRSLSSTVVGVATVQEENGFYGSIMAAQHIDPTVALAIDVTHATDVPDISKEKHGECCLGEGPVLSIGSVTHKKVNALLERVAKDNGIKIQKQISPECTGTDADGIFTKHGGIPTGTVSIPNRYTHSPCELLSVDDLEWTVDLIYRWCEAIDGNTEWK